MNNYNNGGHRKGGGGFKGGSSFGGSRGGDRGGRGGRGGERSGGGERRSGGRSIETFKAECSKCGKSCTLPFKPNGQKPVFCSDCFEKQGDGGGRFDDRGGRGEGSKPPRSERKPRHDRPAAASAAVPNRELLEVKQQLTKIENRLNRILDLINPPTPPVQKVATEEVSPEQATTKKAVKKVVKKAAVKKTPAKKVAKKAVKKTVKKVAKKAAKKTSKAK